MAVTVQDVEHVAKLARLEFSAGEKEKLTHHLNEILAYMEKLNELDTTGVKPLSHVIDLQNVMREDVVQPSLPREEVLMNAPEKTEKFFKVPKVIG
ncbi:MAG TPA: Asp-tRNA(Asn)/Glu-tRNA(Gln) amidotransferase subunit GatC [Bacteroidota bacterium]|jgi:aspartyl-tRNA(Asn)/glutamyl-tRNA(Gln) amidotransferase subunit C|nr:Asp-tRNA(Asn)/Glu-tRNA(Gln) amidotransferase subunit GatC [Bacteroidota bacterium]